MTNLPQNSGIAIALAWPDTYCKQAGAWYDPLMNVLKISKNNYYKVGHSALVLIKNGGTECHYFDFGRYHAPKGHGRVRNKLTDNELQLKTIPKIENKKLLNYDELLTELQSSSVFHGDGDLYSSYVEIDFIKAYTKAIEMQSNSPIVYGPFVKNGTNCSRFVSSVILAGLSLKEERFKLKYFVPFTPSPSSNVKALPKQAIKQKPENHKIFTPKKQAKQKLKSTLQPPTCPSFLPKTVQWLSGEGSGSWFCLQQEKTAIKITRFSPKGDLECSGLFQAKTKNNFRLSQGFKITHLRNCQQVTIIQGEQKIILTRI